MVLFYRLLRAGNVGVTQAWAVQPSSDGARLKGGYSRLDRETALSTDGNDIYFCFDSQVGSGIKGCGRRDRKAYGFVWIEQLGT